MQVDKTLISRRFAKAATSYERQADIQRCVADTLLGLLSPEIRCTPQSIFEIGCCTGLLTKQILHQFPEIKTLYVNDLSSEFKPYLDAVPKPHGLDYLFLNGDIEKIILQIESRFDLIISSSTFHWFHDLGLFFKHIQPCLNKNGLLAFSLYGPDNLSEIRELTGIGLDYHTMADIEKLLAPYFSLLTKTEQRECYIMQSPMEVLRHLRETGVNGLTKRFWHKSDLEAFNTEYKKRFPSGNGVRLTYHPMFFLARPLS